MKAPPQAVLVLALGVILLTWGCQQTSVVPLGGGSADGSTIAPDAHATVDAAIDSGTCALPTDGAVASVPGTDGGQPGGVTITVCNNTNQPVYIGDLGSWVMSGSNLVHDVDEGVENPDAGQGELSLYMFGMTCDEVAADSAMCGGHGDGAYGSVQIRSGAGFVDTWRAIAWQRSRLSDPPCSLCMREVPAPAARYIVRLHVGTQLNAQGRLTDYETVEQPFDWPEETEVVVELR